MGVWDEDLRAVQYPSAPALAGGGREVGGIDAVICLDDRDRIGAGESLKTVYYESGGYVAGALQEIDYTLRDFRANEVKPIDPRLLDLLVELRDRLGTTAPYDVISGYRSPKTNAMLHASSEGVTVH